MRTLITGTSGHLGEALARALRASGEDTLGIDTLPGAFTQKVGSISDRGFVRRCMAGVDAVLHTATLHKPHIVTHSRQSFVDTNITGTLNVLEEAVSAKTRSFVFTSTTSVFGNALAPAPDAPAAWITEEVVPRPRNIYGITKRAAEDLCELFHRRFGLPCLILRTSRFFPDHDDRQEVREAYDDLNMKINEYLYRRVDIDDAVRAHLLARTRARALGFGRYIISATTPFSSADATELRRNAPLVVRRYYPHYEEEYRRRGWRMVPSIERVYVNAKAREDLG